jgi:hypothetical protein
VRENIYLQSWTQNGSRKFWIIQQLSTVDTPPSSPQPTPRRYARIQRLYNAELRLLTDSDTRNTAAAIHEHGADTLALMSNWMRRTEWTSTYEHTRRDMLIRLSKPLNRQGSPLYIGQYAAQLNLSSPAEVEHRLIKVGKALDRLFDRCEDTVRHIDISIRYWLRSYLRNKPYKYSFEIPGRDSTRKVYRRL